MVFSVTPLYALPVAAIYLLLWFRVSSIRSEAKVSFGDGGNPVLLQRIRQHGNCAEWSGFVLILMSVPGGRPPAPSCGASGSSKLERTKVRTPCTMAISTERTCSTLAPSEAISSISSKAMRSRRRARGTMRGSVV